MFWWGGGGGGVLGIECVKVLFIDVKMKAVK
jgi:hypothetical protein